MKAEILWAWRRINANYWFYPALFAAGALVLALLCIWVDRSGHAAWIGDIAWLAPARPEGASTMLQVIAASMIGVASTVFSITIVAVSYASGTYGPRLLVNFMEDKGNQLSLATFIGTFVFALTVLRSVRALDEVSATDSASSALPGFVPQFSLLVALVLMGLAIAVLVYFLNHVPSAIRISRVIEGIGSRLLRTVEQTYPQEGTQDCPAHRHTGKPLPARKAGYVQLIDFAKLARIARANGQQVALQVRTGDFVHPGLPLLKMTGGKDPADCASELHECFTLGFARTPEQDPQFLIDELVEIGLRALSPGINDPFTAITALHWLGAATAKIGTRRLVKDLCAKEETDEDCPVYPLADDFGHYVKRGFGAMRSAVATSPIATKVMLEVLCNVARTIGSQDRRQILLAEAGQLREQAMIALKGPDQREVEAQFGKLLSGYRQAIIKPD